MATPDIPVNMSLVGPDTDAAPSSGNECPKPTAEHNKNAKSCEIIRNEWFQ